MKKTYIKPTMACININTEAIIALSVQGDTEITNENRGDFEMYGREDRPSNPNIWDQQW